nr:steryl-sulfatase-like [Oryctolagus cuniculus]
MTDSLDPPPGSAVFKAFFTPKFRPAGANSCFPTHVCLCQGPTHMTSYDPPLLFNLARDPGEAAPLTPHTEPHHQAILGAILEVVAEHRGSVSNVPNQLAPHGLEAMAEALGGWGLRAVAMHLLGSWGHSQHGCWPSLSHTQIWLHPWLLAIFILDMVLGPRVARSAIFILDMNLWLHPWISRPSLTQT